MGPVGEAQHVRSANTARTMLTVETQLYGFMEGPAQRLKYVHVLLGPHQRPPAGRPSQGLGEARAPVRRRVTAPFLAVPNQPRCSVRVTQGG